jgi:hypothetical protein
MAYPKNYKTIHIQQDLHFELCNLNEFGNVGIQEKIRQLLRYYKAKKEDNKNV